MPINEMIKSKKFWAMLLGGVLDENYSADMRAAALLTIAQGEYLAEMNENEASKIRDGKHGAFGKLMTNAYNAARQARFEHRETPDFARK